MLLLVIKINVFIDFNFPDEFFNFINGCIFVFYEIEVIIFDFLDFLIFVDDVLFYLIIEKQAIRNCLLMDLFCLFFWKYVLRIFTFEWYSTCFVFSYDFFWVLSFLEHFEHQQNVSVNIIATKASTLNSQLFRFLVPINGRNNIFRFDPVLSNVCYDLHKRFNRFWLFILLLHFFFKIHCFLNAVFYFFYVLRILNENLLGVNH